MHGSSRPAKSTRLPAIRLKAAIRIFYLACFPLFLFLIACNKRQLADSPSNSDRLSSSALSKQQPPIDSRFEHWAPGTVKVEAVVYDCQEGLGNRLSERPLMMDGEKHPFIVKTQTKILSSDGVTRLATLLSVSHDTSNRGILLYSTSRFFVL